MSAAAESEPRPLLEWLLRRYPDTPKGRAKQWILAGRVRVAGEPVRKPQQMMTDPGDSLRLEDRGAATLDCGPGLRIHPRVTLLHLDSALAVVNKGPGLISVPAPGVELSALSIVADYLTGALRPRDRNAASKILPALYRRLKPLPVHRLDQYTTGVFCLATNADARRQLIEQLQAHTMRREYVAFAEGRASVPRGTWRHWLQLSRDGLRQQVVSRHEARARGSEAQEAVTHFEVIAEYPLAERQGYVSQLRLRLETGRKHQIRLQAATEGMPLIGDRTYNPLYGNPRQPGQRIAFERQALHAELLSLEHPEQAGERMAWTAAWPDDLRQLESALRSARR